MRIQNVTEKNIFAIPALVVIVADSKSTDVLIDISKEKNTEYAARYIQNVGGNNAYYAFGQDCDNRNSYHGYLVPGQQLDCSNTGQRVAVFSVGGTSISQTQFIRRDNSKHVTILGGKNVPI